MPKFSEDTFNTWRFPPSDTEEIRLNNAQKQVKDIINEDESLNKLAIEIFPQGSYANDTNVRLNSDVDINIMYKDEFFFELPQGKTNIDFGFELSNKLSFATYKNLIENSLVTGFGRENVKRENKCIRILGSSTRVECDVVPTFLHRRFSLNKTYIEGIEFFSDSNNMIIGFPKQHIQNAINKNTLTGRKFKRATRIFKRLRYRLKDEGVAFPESITSFLLECLTWNIPNNIYNESGTWTEIVKQIIIYVYNETKSEQTCKEWREVSELLYLFHAERKWTFQDVNNYMKILWNYLEF